MKIVARLVDSVIAAARAPCRVKCSVVTNATALGRGVAPPAPALASWSLLVVSPAFRRQPGSNYRSSHGPACPMSRALSCVQHSGSTLTCTAYPPARPAAARGHAARTGRGAGRQHVPANSSRRGRLRNDRRRAAHTARHPSYRRPRPSPPGTSRPRQAERSWIHPDRPRRSLAHGRYPVHPCRSRRACRGVFRGRRRAVRLRQARAAGAVGERVSRSGSTRDCRWLVAWLVRSPAPRGLT
jgi:hypothetical protein